MKTKNNLLPENIEKIKRMTKILIENDFDDDNVIFKNDDTCLVVGKKDRFEERYFSCYKVRIKNDKIVSEEVITNKRFKKLVDAQNFINEM